MKNLFVYHSYSHVSFKISFLSLKELKYYFQYNFDWTEKKLNLTYIIKIDLIPYTTSLLFLVYLFILHRVCNFDINLTKPFPLQSILSQNSKFYFLLIFVRSKPGTSSHLIFLMLSEILINSTWIPCGRIPY